MTYASKFGNYLIKLALAFLIYTIIHFPCSKRSAERASARAMTGSPTPMETCSSRAANMDVSQLIDSRSININRYQKLLEDDFVFRRLFPRHRDLHHHCALWMKMIYIG
jgi:hypothetical protein